MSNKTATAPATATTATETVEDKFDRSEFSRVMAMVRHEVSGLITDAQRRTPFYASSKQEAIAKRDAAMKVLTEFANRIDELKKDV